MAEGVQFSYGLYDFCAVWCRRCCFRYLAQQSSAVFEVCVHFHFAFGLSLSTWPNHRMERMAGNVLVSFQSLLSAIAHADGPAMEFGRALISGG